MYWSILHRMIFWELLRVFSLALVALTGMLVMGGVVAEATQHGLGPMQLLMAIPLLIPSTLPYTLPATTLFATCVVYGRLAHDNEILALKAAGIHLWHVIWPAALLGVLTSGLTTFLSLDLIPTTHHQLRTLFISDVEEFLYGMLKREGSIHHSKMPYTIYVQRVQGASCSMPCSCAAIPRTSTTTSSPGREAELLVDLPQKKIHVHMHHCYIINDNGTDDVYVEDKVWPMDLPTDITDAGKKSSARAMTWLEIYDEMYKLEYDKQRYIEEIAAHQAVINSGQAPSHFEDAVKNRIREVRHIETKLHFLETELHMRPALAMGCLCFVLVGCPVGIWFSRSDYLSAFITCFLPIVVIYYPLMLCGINLSKLGKLNPWVLIWSRRCPHGPHRRRLVPQIAEELTARASRF